MFLSRFFRDPYPDLDWIQVEVTSVCNAACVYCPHTVYRDRWRERHMPVEIFRSLLPAFRSAGLVFLQGWGEPLTHPRLLDMIRMAKAERCAVGTTTNGTLLDRRWVEAFVDTGLDVLGFSLAGLDERNDAVRRGTRFCRVMEAMETVRAVREQRGARRPRVHAAYMLLGTGLDELDRLPERLASAGVEKTVISSLSFVPGPELEGAARLVRGAGEWPGLRKRLLDTRAEAAARSLDVRYHIVSPVGEATGCSEGVQQALVVGAEGAVAPCVMKGMPIRGPCSHRFSGRSVSHANRVFGQVDRVGLNTLWHREDYVRFRDTHRLGGVPDSCRHCLKRYIDPLV